MWRGDEFIGILFHWGADGYRYVEHLAVSPALRGQNMGSAALSAFCRKVGRVILEIDPPVDDISIRRLHFYERLGFVANPYSTSTLRSETLHAPSADPDELSAPLHTTKPAAADSYGRRCSAIRARSPTLPKLP
ncbi:MAG: GNAT family N-acetyltransferase [Alistipes finegoldii]